jgi:hypothetical protein
MSWDILKIISVIYIAKNEGWVCSFGWEAGGVFRTMKVDFFINPF